MTHTRTAAPLPGAGPDTAGDFAPQPGTRPNTPITARDLELLAANPEARLWRHLPTGAVGLTFWNREVNEIAALGQFVEIAPHVWTH